MLQEVLHSESFSVKTSGGVFCEKRLEYGWICCGITPNMASSPLIIVLGDCTIHHVLVVPYIQVRHGEGRGMQK